MMTRAFQEDTLRGPTAVYPGSYDSSKVNLASLIFQNTGTNATDKWCGPALCATAHPYEDFATQPGLVCTWSWSSTIQWLFVSSVNAAGNIAFYESNLATGTLIYRGYIIPTYPPTGSVTVKGMSAYVYKHTEGTVAVSGTAVTGTSTTWSADRLAAGARIGFGSTDPTQITTWYYLSSIGSDTSITLTGSAGTVAGGTSYVIEELRLVIAGINSTPTNGGLFLIKGLNHESFTIGGTTIAAAVSTDNIQAVYWLADASTVTNTTAAGLALSSTSRSNTTHFAYIVNGASSTNASLYQYNIRAALTLSSGKDTTTNTIKTGTATTTALNSYGGNLVMANTGHGPGQGVNCLYLAGSSKIHRIRETDIVASSTTFLSDAMTPAVLTGLLLSGIGAFVSLDYDSQLDRFIVGNSAPGTYPCFLTAYDPVANTIESMFPLFDLFTKTAAYAPFMVNHPSYNYVSGIGLFTVSCAGQFYMSVPATGAAVYCAIHSFPGGAHWSRASSAKQWLITPSIPTTGCTKFYRAHPNAAKNLGDPELGWNPEPFRVYARTVGISDDSGGWILLDDTGDLSGFAAATAIQFKFEFRTVSKQCIPARIYSMGVSYEKQDSIPSQYEWNFADSDTTNGTFGFDQVAVLGSTPRFQIDYYRSDTGNNCLTQKSTSTTVGTFQYWNGSAWTAGVGSDAVGVRRRFVPSTGLPGGNVNVNAVLSLF